MSEQTNVVPFPLTVRSVLSAVDAACSATKYEFTEEELAALCRWFSAMKYAFPGTEGVMMVSHQESYSAVGLYNRAGGAPNCLVAKHEVGGAIRRVRSKTCPRLPTPTFAPFVRRAMKRAGSIRPGGWVSMHRV